MKELFSRRYRDRNGDPEVYIYNNFSPAFRNQCFHIVKSLIMELSDLTSFSIASDVCAPYAREKGLKYLKDPFNCVNNLTAVEVYFDTRSHEDFLDLLDFIFVNVVASDYYQEYFLNHRKNPLIAAADELNLRFKQHSLGYEFTNGEIIPKTNEHIHQEVVKPALKLLTDERFRGAEQEYLMAFSHLKAGNNKDAILNAGKAFESVMKTICSELGYPYKPTDPAKKLIECLKQNGFFPAYLDSQLNHLCGLLESGAPTTRNKESGHGQGVTITNPTDGCVEFILNIVASNMVFFYRLYKEKTT